MLDYPLSVILVLVALAALGTIALYIDRRSSLRDSDGFIALDDYITDLDRRNKLLIRHNEKLEKDMRLHKSVKVMLKEQIDTITDESKSLRHAQEALHKAMAGMQQEIAYLKNPPVLPDLTDDELEDWQQSEAQAVPPAVTQIQDSINQALFNSNYDSHVSGES
jgi:hypothetical protein